MGAKVRGGAYRGGTSAGVGRSAEVGVGKAGNNGGANVKRAGVQPAARSMA